MVTDLLHAYKECSCQERTQLPPDTPCILEGYCKQIAAPHTNISVDITCTKESITCRSQLDNTLNAPNPADNNLTVITAATAINTAPFLHPVATAAKQHTTPIALAPPMVSTTQALLATTFFSRIQATSDCFHLQPEQPDNYRRPNPSDSFVISPAELIYSNDTFCMELTNQMVKILNFLGTKNVFPFPTFTNIINNHVNAKGLLQEMLMFHNVGPMVMAANITTNKIFSGTLTSSQAASLLASILEKGMSFLATVQSTIPCRWTDPNVPLTNLAAALNTETIPTGHLTPVVGTKTKIAKAEHKFHNTTHPEQRYYLLLPFSTLNLVLS